MESIGRIEDKTLNMAIKNDLVEKVGLMTNAELLEALQNARQSYAILEDEGQNRGRKEHNSANPSEQKRQRAELLMKMEAIAAEQKLRGEKN
jgi:hypothetical protein